MGLFDLPAPVFGAIDGMLAMALPALLRLAVWAILAGWITMWVYGRFSNQEKIRTLKTRQKQQQNAIAGFDGEFSQLMPLIRDALALGFRQLGLSLGPALLATVPVVFIIVWVSGEYGYELPPAGSEILVVAEPAGGEISWSPAPDARRHENGWLVKWPAQGQSLTISEAGRALLTLPPDHAVAVIHKKRWWNLLMANPLGYLPQDGHTDSVHLALPEVVLIGAGPVWIRGWMFSFFGIFLLSSIAFRQLLRLD